MLILTLIAVVLGYVVGVKAPLILQVILFLGCFMWLIQPKHEIRTCFYLMIWIGGIAGAVVGNIVWFYTLGATSEFTATVLKSIQWLFTPT